MRIHFGLLAALLALTTPAWLGGCPPTADDDAGDDDAGDDDAGDDDSGDDDSGDDDSGDDDAGDDDSGDDDSGDDDAGPVDADGDGWNENVDCDDGDPDIHPGATEIPCDGIDQNCLDGDLRDLDFDGYDGCKGDPDCDDTSAAIHPGAVEVPYDGIDQDCDGFDLTDVDGDTHDGGPAGDDCDDGDPAIHPGAPEGCDGIDTDCDGSPAADEVDGDADGWMICAGDCDDAEALTWPGAPEQCDQADNDCDGTADEDVDVDVDGDGVTACEGDCDMDDPAVHPGAQEICDGKDSDCDGTLPPNEADADGDGVPLCGGDCDDNDPTVYPGAVEIWGDGIDQDCQGGDPTAYGFSIDLQFEATGGASGGPATVTFTWNLIDVNQNVLCDAIHEFDSTYSAGPAQGADFWDELDEVITHNSLATLSGACDAGAVQGYMYTGDAVTELQWFMNPLAFLSCDAITADPALGGTHFADDIFGLGANGTFDEYCTIVGPTIQSSLGSGPMEATWLLPGHVGDLDALGTFGYFAPPSTANVEVWMAMGLLMADAANPNEPGTQGLEGSYLGVPFWLWIY